MTNQLQIDDHAEYLRYASALDAAVRHAYVPKYYRIVLELCAGDGSRFSLLNVTNCRKFIQVEMVKAFLMQSIQNVKVAMARANVSKYAFQHLPILGRI